MSSPTLNVLKNESGEPHRNSAGRPKNADQQSPTVASVPGTTMSELATDPSLPGCKFIYAPKGQAGEYAPLAANPYRGCGHGCAYCYVPLVIKMDRAKFDEGAYPRKDYLLNLRKDALKYQAAGIREQDFFSFTTDVYQAFDRSLTRPSLQIIQEHGMGVCSPSPFLLSARPPCGTFGSAERQGGSQNEKALPLPDSVGGRSRRAIAPVPDMQRRPHRRETTAGTQAASAERTDRRAGERRYLLAEKAFARLHRNSRIGTKLYPVGVGVNQIGTVASLLSPLLLMLLLFFPFVWRFPSSRWLVAGGYVAKPYIRRGFR
jgi:hypothetical protein